MAPWEVSKGKRIMNLTTAGAIVFFLLLGGGALYVWLSKDRRDAVREMCRIVFMVALLVFLMSHAQHCGASISVH